MNKKQDWAVWGLAAVVAALVWGLWRRVERRLEGQRLEEQPGRLSLNRASPEALQTLPGIGPVMAERIVAARPFASVEDLLRVEGVGEVTLEALAPLVRP